MLKTKTVKQSINALSQGKKIFKRDSLYDVAKVIIKAQKYGLINTDCLQKNIEEIEDARYKRNCEYLEKVFKGE